MLAFCAGRATPEKETAGPPARLSPRSRENHRQSRAGISSGAPGEARSRLGRAGFSVATPLVGRKRNLARPPALCSLGVGKEASGERGMLNNKGEETGCLPVPAPQPTQAIPSLAAEITWTVRGPAWKMAEAIGAGRPTTTGEVARIISGTSEQLGVVRNAAPRYYGSRSMCPIFDRKGRAGAFHAMPCQPNPTSTSPPHPSAPLPHRAAPSPSFGRTWRGWAASLPGGNRPGGLSRRRRGPCRRSFARL